ncbi:Peroxidasin [Folsomia candida]|uniref:Peroxidasin n=1 Tax=Folsomia candida TaxID=158441 RepID=A0A226CVW8_FOLCA|nr:Peroxidasin [Folsomia candida]
MENLNLVCPAKCHPLQLETPERARFTPLGHGYKLETPERRFTPLVWLESSCQMPPVTARDSGKGAFYAPRPWLQTYKTTFAITLKESEKTPKYRNYMKRENLNLVCPAKCHPLQLETPERARCTPLGVDLKVYNQL